MDGTSTCRPRTGAQAAVAEAARNIVCTGAVPMAITNNLNFGNPEKPHIYYQLSESVQGMAEACRIFETPVTGGNVSLYNETDGRAIYPTPVVGMVGVVEDVDHITTADFKNVGDAIILLGDNTNELGGSEYLYVFHDLVAGAPPSVDLLGERSLQQAVLGMITKGLVASAHDCAEGGLAIALAESAVGGEQTLGVDVALTDALPVVPLFFGEAQGRIIVSCAPDNVDAVLEVAKSHAVPVRRIGTVVAAADGFNIRAGEHAISVDPMAAHTARSRALPDRMDKAPATVTGEGQ